VSATGIHGANRLASNSLLEAAVYARRVAEDIQSRSDAPVENENSVPQLRQPNGVHEVELAATVKEIRKLMTRQVGIARNEVELRAALLQLENIGTKLADTPGEVSNMLLVARLVTLAALLRTESRGAHFRNDHPQPMQAWQHNQSITVDALCESHGQVDSANILGQRPYGDEIHSSRGDTV
jgi:L-aspartate oxidase